MGEGWGRSWGPSGVTVQSLSCLKSHPRPLPIPTASIPAQGFETAMRAQKRGWGGGGTVWPGSCPPFLASPRGLVHHVSGDPHRAPASAPCPDFMTMGVKNLCLHLCLTPRHSMLALLAQPTLVPQGIAAQSPKWLWWLDPEGSEAGTRWNILALGQNMRKLMRGSEVSGNDGPPSTLNRPRLIWLGLGARHSATGGMLVSRPAGVSGGDQDRSSAH